MSVESMIHTYSYVSLLKVDKTFYCLFTHHVSTKSYSSVYVDYRKVKHIQRLLLTIILPFFYELDDL